MTILIVHYGVSELVHSLLSYT